MYDREAITNKYSKGFLRQSKIAHIKSAKKEGTHDFNLLMRVLQKTKLNNKTTYGRKGTTCTNT